MQNHSEIVTELLVLLDLLGLRCGMRNLRKVPSVLSQKKSSASDYPISCFFFPSPYSRLFALKTGIPGQSTGRCQWRWQFLFMPVIWKFHLGSQSSLIQLEEIVLEWSQLFLFFIIILLFAVVRLMCRMLSGRRNGTKERIKNIKTI